MKFIRKKSGFALVTALIFLIIITIIGITVSRITTSDVRMANNLTYKERSFAAAEAIKDSSIDILLSYYTDFLGEWPSALGGTGIDDNFTNRGAVGTFNLGAGLSIPNPTLNLRVTNDASWDRTNPSTENLPTLLAMSLDTDRDGQSDLRGDMSSAYLYSGFIPGNDVSATTEYTTGIAGAGAVFSLYYLHFQGDFGNGNNALATTEITIDLLTR